MLKNQWTRRTFLRSAGICSLGTAATGRGLCAAEIRVAEADVLLQGGTLYDGTGAEAVAGDVAIRGERIVAVGNFKVDRVVQVIDCTGLIVTPGFIDLHTHSDRSLTKPELRANANYLKQGCSTVVTGNCGLGPADVGGYLERLEKQGVGSNVIHLAAYGPIRSAAMKNAGRRPTAEEMASLKTLTDRAMRAGAWGMSTGLYYAWNAHAEIDELVQVASVVASHGGLYASHIRNESDGLVDSVREALEIGRRAGLPVHVSHFKSSFKPNWGKLRDAAAVIEEARRQGQHATADQYPYIASSTSFVPSVVPLQGIPGGNKNLRERMKADPGLDRQVRELLRSRLANTQDVLLCSCKKEAWKCRRISEIAAAEQVDPVEVVLEVYCSGGGSVVNFAMCEEDVQYGMTLPWVATASDGWGAAPTTSPVFHPRLFGTFPRKIGRYVLEQKVLGMAQAIRSCTGLPADILRLNDRGYLRPQAFADVLAFDPKTFRDHATFEKPGVYAGGVRWLFVNGEPAISDGGVTPTLCGRVLRHPSAAQAVRPRQGPSSSILDPATLLARRRTDSLPPHS